VDLDFFVFRFDWLKIPKKDFDWFREISSVFDWMMGLIVTMVDWEVAMGVDDLLMLI